MEIGSLTFRQSRQPRNKDWSSPEVVLQQYGKAVIESKVGDAAKFMTGESLDCFANFMPFDIPDFQKKLAAISDDDFVIKGNTAEIKFDAKTKYFLRKIDGKWLLDLTKSTAAE